MLTNRSRRVMSYAGAISPVTLVFTVNQSLAYVLIILIAGILTVVSAVVLPAVWSRRCSRRAAAFKVINAGLQAVRDRPSADTRRHS